MRFFVGGYTPDLNVAWLDANDGALELVTKVTTPENASFLRYEPAYRTVYAAVETGYRTGESGKVAAYRVDDQGKLTAIGTADSGGAGPCHIDVDPTHGLLAVANYGGETFSVLRLQDDGRLGDPVATVHHSGSSVNRSRQSEPHPHSTTFAPGGRYLFVADLGTDAVMRYSVDDLIASGDAAKGEVAYQATPGAGPRHIAFSIDGKFVYVVTELGNTVVALGFDPTSGALSPLEEISTLPETFDGESAAAEIQVHPNDRFVYASNRGHDTVAVFSRDASSGLLEPAGHFNTTGAGPRHFQVDPSGAWCLVANQGSDHVVSFAIDPASGMGTYTGKSVRVVAASCAEFWR